MSEREQPPKDPSLLSDIKTVTLEFVKFKRKASRTAQSGAIGAGIIGAAFGGPVGAVVGMGVGLVAGEVTDIRADRWTARNSRRQL